MLDNPESLQTDSGRIEIDRNGKAVLIAKDGTVRGRGYFFHGKPAGAWVRYDSLGNILSAAHLLDGKSLCELDKNDFYFTSWKNDTMGASFMVPKSWKQIPSPNSALLVSFEKEISDTTIRVKPNFNVTHAKLQPGDNLQSLARMELQMLQEKMGSVEVVDEAFITVDSCNAFRRYGKYSNGNASVGFLDLIIISGNDAWFFSCEAQNKTQGEFLRYQGVFQEITESFRRTR